MLWRATGAVTIAASLLFGSLASALLLSSHGMTPWAFILPLTLTCSSLAAGLIAYDRKRWANSAAVMAMPMLILLSGGSAVLLIFSAGAWVLLLPMLVMASAITMGFRTNWEGI